MICNDNDNSIELSSPEGKNQDSSKVCVDPLTNSSDQDVITALKQTQEITDVFAILPQKGTVYPDEEVTFTITCSPHSSDLTTKLCSQFECLLRLHTSLPTKKSETIIKPLFEAVVIATLSVCKVNATLTFLIELCSFFMSVEDKP